MNEQATPANCEQPEGRPGAALVLPLPLEDDSQVASLSTCRHALKGL